MRVAKLLVATHNPHKLEEIRAILNPLISGFDPRSVVSAAEFDIAEPVEDALTFEGNALIKARTIARKTGMPTIADDSGLAVDVLGGAPGIFSARWCGRHGDDEANLDLLLGQLADVPAEHRGAQFVCAAALVLPGGAEWTTEGVMKGRLRHERAGLNGFGYDPIFEPEGYTVTNAELDPAVKNRISHRFRAFSALGRHIAEQVYWTGDIC
ncbi:MAG: RdgB/HAM1 family non-canonical purine NTP pyrophosphatase [Actinomycetaceae bacterium]|nr:RdgB/HAM1 family non-canonical purine NTP pyrophosphatase [Actinomycetaceae bacterium]